MSSIIEKLFIKVITRYDLEQLNLALETENLRLEKSTKKKICLD